MADAIRVLPKQDERVETGVIEFQGDWPGVFIRGDNALAYALYLDTVLKGVADPISIANVRSLLALLQSCRV